MCQRALKYIQQRRSWSCMKTALPTIVMTAPATSIELPSNFKELQTGDAPIRVMCTEVGLARPIPCIVMTKREIERDYSKFAYGVLSTWYRFQTQRLPVYMDQSGGVWTINIIFQPQPALNFLVDCYSFLPTPQANDDTNFFLSNYEEMAMAKAKEIVWASVNDEFAEEQAALFSREFKRAAHDDSYRLTRGVEMRM